MTDLEAPMRGVDLNVDLGEIDGEPEELYRLATVVNVACGGHAGDAESMRRACRLASAAGARVAAHPSYPDREGFGRRAVAMDEVALARSIESQCGELAKLAEAAGLEVSLVKPHGALYHEASRSEAAARAVLAGARAALGDHLAGVVGAGGAIRAVALERGVTFVAEGFADRGYDATGGLVPRGEPRAVLVDPAAAAEQALRLARSGTVGTLCVHGDNPAAVVVARAVREALVREGLLLPRHVSGSSSRGGVVEP